jgi:hypothetical protein
VFDWATAPAAKSFAIIGNCCFSFVAISSPYSTAQGVSESNPEAAVKRNWGYSPASPAVLWQGGALVTLRRERGQF